MKKYIAFSFVAVGLLIMSSFISNAPNTEKINGDDKTTASNAEVWEYMHENVFDELGVLVNYDKKRMFSRCPSGFSQYMDTDNSNKDFVYGTITFAQGCDRDEFCMYKINWNAKKTFLKKKKQDEFLALDDYVKEQKGKIAKI